MLSAADQHESARIARAAQHAAAEPAGGSVGGGGGGAGAGGGAGGGAGEGGAGGGQPAFLEAVRRDAAGGQGGSVEEAVRRRQHYSQRPSDAADGRAFARH